MALYAELAELADAVDLKSTGLIPYRFESGIPYQPYNKVSLFKSCITSKLYKTPIG